MHDLAGVLKLYFRTIPEPLCTNENINQFLLIKGIAHIGDIKL